MSAEGISLQLNAPIRTTADYLKKRSVDLLICGLLAIGGVAFAIMLSLQINPAIFGIYADNTWFQADIARTSANMGIPASDHYRTKIHPIVSLISLPATKAIGLVWPGTYYELATRFVALIGGLWVAGIYLLGRTLGAARITALAFALLGVSSAAFVFWFSVPETYGLGALTILATLIIAALAESRQLPQRWYIGASAATLSITLTNWMAGLALAFTRMPWRKAMRITLQALAIIAVLAIIQKIILPSSQLFFIPSNQEATFINRPDSGTVWNKLNALLLHAFAVPSTTIKSAVEPFWPMLSVQFSRPGSGSTFGLWALVLWVSLLVLGTWGGFRARRPIFVAMLWLIIVGQIALHLLYGEETFLYVLHLMPLLIAVALLSIYTPAKKFVPVIALAAALLGLLNNLEVYGKTSAQLAQFLTPREQVLQAMNQRSQEIWPRGMGHVVLGKAGSDLSAKAYHEPGAAFSPAPGSFGVSFWISDQKGNVVAASETLPLQEIHQSLIWHDAHSLASVHTETKYFNAEWLHDDTLSKLTIKPSPSLSNLKLWMVMRSVGPAGGLLKNAELADNGFIFNRQWQVESSSPLLQQIVDDESKHGVHLSHERAGTASSPTGWLYAAAELKTDSPTQITIRPVGTQPAQRKLVPGNPLWTPDVPDHDFSASATAQQAHLLMGLTDGQTRPGDPMNYTYPWIRDAAYVVAALSKAGQLRTARDLAPEIAERDFFGGFGPEADGPGLSLWALNELAEVMDDRAFDQWLWPHAQRKVQWIQDCLHAEKPVMVESQMQLNYSPWTMVTKQFRVCERSREGLMIGRMDNQFPVLSVNATAYGGLMSAARLALRLGHEDKADEYIQQADALKAAWQREFMKPRMEKVMDTAEHWQELVHDLAQEPRVRTVERHMNIARNWIGNNRNERMLVASQWPSWVIGDSHHVKEEYKAALQAKWQATHSYGDDYSVRPLWTYFEFAQAHQWLLMGSPEHAWKILEWFFKHQSSEGLYTWWEGAKEENTTHRWPSVRGWVKPANVTPHYWTAAEALMLQLDMLTYVDQSTPQRPLVIGAGVPQAWLSSTIDSGIIMTIHGPVHWKWHDNELEVDVSKPNVPVELGAAFKGKPLKVIHKKELQAAQKL
ncbi:MAG TPA: hypothetical protein VFF74_08625 [Methylophilaceae bacterium]|nr:hypothetical protein [Methylophilaceae bacterium]